MVLLHDILQLSHCFNVGTCAIKIIPKYSQKSKILWMLKKNLNKHKRLEILINTGSISGVILSETTEIITLFPVDTEYFQNLQLYFIIRNMNIFHSRLSFFNGCQVIKKLT